MIRGNNRQQIFYGDEYFSYFILLLKESTEKFDHKILGFCLMTNHAHMIIHIHDSSLSMIMKNINFRYARWLNQRRKRIGHLFQGRFRSLHVDNEEYLIYLCRYIHLNPVAAKMAAKAGDYLWSSHHYYFSENPPSWMNIDLILSIIFKKTNLNYNNFICQEVNREKWKPAIYISETGEIINNNDEIKNLEKKNIADSKIHRRKLPQEVVSAIVCSNLNIEQTKLFGRSKNHILTKKRALLASYLVRYSDVNIVSLAKLFQITHGTLSRQLNQLTSNPEVVFSNELLKIIEHALINVEKQKKARRHD
ncbi:MAG: hypothetical protein A3E82_09385 [Gammaproteobacteria bacterium RIFCSPHIGHO2_12_FULL_38_11]|nr:MAG: hypothetical protein A3E82_09385 [Gammaproteobacteria bacterium RIFCSPHIGHO2_12_FULL_38_11]